MYASDKNRKLIGVDDVITFKIKNKLVEAVVIDIDKHYIHCESENKQFKLNRNSAKKHVTVLNEEKEQTTDVGKSNLLKNLMNNTKYESPLNESINSGIGLAQLPSLGLNVAQGFKFGQKQKLDSELKNRYLVLEFLTNVYNISSQYEDLYGISKTVKKLAREMNLNLLEYKSNTKKSLDYNMIMTGDLVNFGKHGKFYVNNPFYSTNKFAVTKNEKERFNESAQGWLIDKKLAKHILENAKI